MIAIRGYFYDGMTSAQVPAECRVYDNGAVRIQALAGCEALCSLPRFELTASPRLADTLRYLYFPKGQKFETEDNRAVDEMLRRFGKRSWLHRVHLLESRKRYLLACVATMLSVLWWAGRYGVPWSAEIVAHHLPQTVIESAGQQALDMLDRSFFKPTKLEESERNRLQAHFRPLELDHPDLNLHVEFRDGGRLGANAMALPDGTLILTDEMVRLAGAPDELLAVLAHEAGHVFHRHGVQRIIQDSLLSFALMAITGDLSGTSHIFLGFPVLLTELAYSRHFEREADQYALDYLRARAIAPRSFSALMRRLQQESGLKKRNPEGHWTSYLSTHPAMDERLALFEESR
jgi:Zn-dependent protease with chaperone function